MPTKRALQNALDDLMGLAKRDPAFFRMLVRAPKRAVMTKKLDLSREIRIGLGNLLSRSRFTVPDQRVLNVGKGDSKLTLNFPYDVIDWFLLPWSLLHEQGCLKVRSGRRRPKKVASQ